VADPVTITERRGLGLATLMARPGIAPAAIGAAIGLDPPTGPGRTALGDLALVGTGPGTWLAVTDAPEPAWPIALEDQLAGLGVLSDQSGAYAVFRIAGPGARTLLQRGAFIDLDPRVFGPGSAATTVIAHIGAILWQLDELPSFEVAVFRSYAASFRHWIDLTAAAL